MKQRWFRAEQRWFPLQQRWFLNNSQWQFSVNFSLSSKVFVVPQFRGTNFWFSAQFTKSIEHRKFTSPFSFRQKNNPHLNFWVYYYCSINKRDIVQLFKNIFAFIGVRFQDYSKKFESLLSICRIFTFSLIQEYHFNDHFVRFQHFGLRYDILIVSSTCVNIRADSE